MTQYLTSVQRFGFLFLASALLLIVSVGCNTAQGFGEDMEKAGESIQEGTK